MTRGKANISNDKGPQQQRSRETVETILKAATRILGKSGVEGLSTNRIAEVAGVSVGSLYQYFRNKESILQTLLTRLLDQGVERSLLILDEDLPPREVVSRLVATALATISQQGPATLYLLEAAPRMIGSKRFELVDRRVMDTVRQKLQQRGLKLRVENPEAALLISMQVVRAAAWLLVRDRGKTVDVATCQRELTDLLCRYLLTDD